MTSEVTQAALKPCPWCGTAEHLSVQWPGSMTADMPDCRCRVVCTHIDHDTVVGPTAYGEVEAIAAWNTRLTAQSGEGRSGAGEDAVTVGLAEQVAEAMEDDGGEWRSCTGCHETNEGYSTGHFAYSAALKCELGSGCRECGGIGAVWDNTDYADMADFMAAADRDHANIKRILIENDIQPYRAEQIAMAITELEIPAALNARQSGEGERLREAAAGVLAHRVDGSTRGWLRDNRDSRAALDALAAALRATDDAGGA